MPDLENRLRDLLAERAASLPDRAEPSPSLVALVERRRRRRATGLAMAAVVVAGVLVGAVVERSRPGDGTRVVADPGPAVTDPGPDGPAPRTVPGMFGFVGLDLFDLSVEPPRRVAGLPGPGAVEGTPVRTPSGVVALQTEESRPGILWLLPTGGAGDGAGRGREAVRLAESVTGFAVAPGGNRVAWSEVRSPSANPVAQLVEARLPGGEALSRGSVRGFGRVVGYAGSAVLLDTGDGASSGVAVWVPGRSPTARPVGPFGDEPVGSVAATDGPGRRAVLTQGDGPCGMVVDVDDGGAVRPVADQRVVDAGCHGNRQAFAPDGSLLAAVAFTNPQEPLVLSVWSLRDGSPRARLVFGDEFVQLVWADAGTVLVVTRNWTGGEHHLHRCPVDSTACEPVLTDRESVRLVEPPR